MSGKYKGRLEQLEATRIKPEPLHIIMGRNEGQTRTEMFDLYQLSRMAEGYTPEQGWQALRVTFMSDNPVDRMKFLSYSVLDSVAPKPPTITRHDEGM